MRLASSGIAAADGVGGEPLRHKLLQHLVAHLKAVLADAMIYVCHNRGSVDKYWGHRNKKHKKQPFSDASASHLSLVLWHV